LSLIMSNWWPDPINGKNCSLSKSTSYNTLVSLW